MIILDVVIVLGNKKVIHFIRVFQLLVNVTTSGYKILFSSDTQLVLSNDAILKRSANCLSVMSNISSEVE